MIRGISQMPTKKSNGEGTVFKEKSGRWRSVITVGRNANGSLKRKYFYGKTKKEVLDKMNDYKYKSNNDLLPTDETITVLEYLNYWLFKYKLNEVKPSTITRYEGIIRNYIEPYSIGKIKLKNLRAAAIQSLYNELIEEKKTTPSTIENINKVLKSSFTQAMKEGYLLRNYCQFVSIPKKTVNTDIVYFSLDEQKRFIEACEGKRLEALFLFALGTGLRVGELLALEWNDISFENANVIVNKSLRQERVFKSDGSSSYDTLIQSTKTDSSNRSVPIPKNILNKLKEYKVNQNKKRLSLGELYYESNLVFTTPIGTPINQSNLRKIYNRILKNANIDRIKFHALRHTYATRLFEQNIQIKTVQVLLGHSDITTTMNIYTHVTEEVKNDAIDKINSIFDIS